MSEVKYHLVEQEQDIGQRLDNFLLKTLKGVPKSHIYRMIRGGEVRINKKRAKPDQRLQAQDLVRIPPVRMTENQTQPLSLAPAMQAQLKAAIIFEDEGLMVINKPSGFAVHGGSGLKWGLIEALRHMRPEIKYLELVHRLDRETSGCLLLAKKSSVLKNLQEQWQAQKVKKIYWALCANSWQGKKQIRVDKPLLKNTLKSGERMVVISQAGKTAVSHFQLIKNAKECCWLQVHIETGRTHQIRVHSSFIGHPILGDEKYGKDLKKMPRLFLHAQSLKFSYQGEIKRFEASLDPSFTQQIEQVSWD
jgi:23S rRNA pseudouridine955/2504/2580 synthase